MVCGARMVRTKCEGITCPNQPRESGCSTIIDISRLWFPSDDCWEFGREWLNRYHMLSWTWQVLLRLPFVEILSVLLCNFDTSYAYNLIRRVTLSIREMLKVFSFFARNRWGRLCPCPNKKTIESNLQTMIKR